MRIEYQSNEYGKYSNTRIQLIRYSVLILVQLMAYLHAKYRYLQTVAQKPFLMHFGSVFWYFEIGL